MRPASYMRTATRMWHINCQNYSQENVCNWIVPAEDEQVQGALADAGTLFSHAPSATAA
jgi:hypothetical protein